MILEVEIKDAKMRSFSNDFQNTHQTLISFLFSLWIVDELKKR